MWFHPLKCFFFAPDVPQVVTCAVLPDLGFCPPGAAPSPAALLLCRGCTAEQAALGLVSVRLHRFFHRSRAPSTANSRKKKAIHYFNPIPGCRCRPGCAPRAPSSPHRPAPLTHRGGRSSPAACAEQTARRAIFREIKPVISLHRPGSGSFLPGAA